MSSGLNVQFGTAVETTYGTPVVVDRFHEITSESLERNQTTLQSNGLRAGTRNLRRRGIVSARQGSGDVNFEVATTGFGRIFRWMTGGTSTITQEGATTAWKQTHSMGSLTGAGSSLTMQKGVPQTDGTVKPFTFHGCKCTGWEFSISVDQILQLRTSVDAEDVDTATGLAVASYGTPKLFHFMQGSLEVDSTAVAAVTGATVAGANNLKTDRFYLGSSGLKKEPLDNDHPAVTGTLDAEFVDQANFYDRFTADSEAELVLEFVGDVIDGAFSETLTITVPEVRFEGETPKVSGPQVVVQNVPFSGFFDGTNPGVTIEYTSTDTAI